MENKEIFAIWLCKPGTISMPYLYEVCLCTWQIMNPSYKLVLYTNTREFSFNLLSKDTTEVRIIDDEFPELEQETNNIITDETPEGMRYAQRSDYIRYTILYKLGGIYIDCDLLCYSSIEPLMEKIHNNHNSVCMAYEYTDRICNAFMACLDDEGKQYFNDIITNYQENYVRTSYTFNSIKYLYILNRKYRNIVEVLPLKEGMFYPNWEHGANGDLNMLMDEKCELTGYGVHLYNTNPEWKSIRNKIDQTMFDDNNSSWLCRHLNNCVKEYISLMTKSKTRDLSKDPLISNILTNLYGENYLKQFDLKEEVPENGCSNIHNMVNKE